MLYHAKLSPPDNIGLPLGFAGLVEQLWLPIRSDRIAMIVFSQVSKAAPKIGNADLKSPHSNRHLPSPHAEVT